MANSKRRTKVLFVNLGATFGGAEVYLLRLLVSLRQEMDCHVLCCQKDLQSSLDELGISYTSIFSGTGLVKLVQLVWAAGVMARLLVSRQIDTLQINGYSEILFVPIARLLGRRAVPTRHLGFDIEASHWAEAPGRFLARWLYRMLARTATRVVCVSEEVGREVEELAPGRVQVIPNWVDVPPYVFRPAAEGSRHFNILFVGRMVPYKGMQLVLEAMRSSHVRDLSVTLIAVGDGPHRSELERLATGLDVRFLGFHRDVSPFYRDADLLITPSLGPEGSSLVTLEAMAHALPCLLSDLPVHREIAREGTIAGLFRSGDAEDLAAQIRRLLLDEALRGRRTRQAHSLVYAEHNGDLAVKAYCSVLAHG